MLSFTGACSGFCTGTFTGWALVCSALVLALFLSPFYQLSSAASTSSLVGLGWKVLVVSVARGPHFGTVTLRSVFPDLGQGWLGDVIRVSVTSSLVHFVMLLLLFFLCFL